MKRDVGKLRVATRCFDSGWITQQNGWVGKPHIRAVGGHGRPSVSAFHDVCLERFIGESSRLCRPPGGERSDSDAPETFRKQNDGGQDAHNRCAYPCYE